MDARGTRRDATVHATIVVRTIHVGAIAGNAWRAERVRFRRSVAHGSVALRRIHVGTVPLACHALDADKHKSPKNGET